MSTAQSRWQDHSDTTRALVRCPRCRAALSSEGEELICVDGACAGRFPVVGGIPVLINEDNSVFCLADFEAKQETTVAFDRPPVVKLLSRLVPSLNGNVRAEENIQRFERLLLGVSDAPRLLVLGCRDVGKGMADIVANPRIDCVNTDVTASHRTEVVVDAHDIPFADGSFDGVIIQTVLEHVADPYRCVAEIVRVLKPGGVVYAETSFIQQIHMRQYDFTRFTHLGHRRLFRAFDEVESGAVSGPGMALAWSYQYFMLSFAHTDFARNAIKVFTRLTAFPLKYFDHRLVQNDAALDGSAVVYFLGRKAEQALTDRELLALYRGGF